MKKTLLSKILAPVLGMTLIMGMSGYAFAADLTSGVAITDETSVNISKVMKVINPDLSSVDGPGMDYSYSIISAVPSDENGGTSVTDAENRTGTVHEGPANGVSLATSTVSFPVGTPLNASSTGTDNRQWHRLPA